MPIADRLLLGVFGAITLVFFATAVLCVRKALKVSGERDGDLKMFLWAFVGFIALIVSGMSAAYILVPIFYHYL
jgi:hypothetical protein